VDPAVTDLFAPPPDGDFAAYPVGTRVVITSPMVDHHFFRREAGTVVRNRGRYLGVIVALDQPFRCDHGHYEHLVDEFNFNPRDLAIEEARNG
jgi:hypothetical protein